MRPSTVRCPTRPDASTSRRQSMKKHSSYANPCDAEWLHPLAADLPTPLTTADEVIE